MARYPLAASAQRHHECFAAGSFLARLHQIRRHVARGLEALREGPSFSSAFSRSTRRPERQQDKGCCRTSRTWEKRSQARTSPTVCDSFLQLLRRAATCLYRCCRYPQEELIDIVLYLPTVAALIVQPLLEPDNEDEIDLTSLNPAQVRELYAAGAYFRDDDGPQGVMAAMDLSWRSDLVESLDPFGRLSTAAAQDLIAAVESRPLTNEQLTLQYFKKLSAWQTSRSFDRGIHRVLLPPDILTFSRSLVHRRSQLLAILKMSVDWGEPLICSID